MTLRNREWLAAVRARHGFAVTRDLRELDAWQRRHDYRLDVLEHLPDAAITARLHECEHLLTMLETTSQWTSLGQLGAIIERGARPLRVGYLLRALTARALACEASGAADDALVAFNADALQAFVVEHRTDRRMVHGVVFLHVEVGAAGKKGRVVSCPLSVVRRAYQRSQPFSDFREVAGNKAICDAPGHRVLHILLGQLLRDIRGCALDAFVARTPTDVAVDGAHGEFRRHDFM